MDRSKNYEKEIPENYVLVRHIDAKSSKGQAPVYSLLANLPLLVIVPSLCVAADRLCGYNIIKNWRGDKVVYVLLITFALNLLYTVLHELTHGLTYKAFTGGKLKFGYMVTVAYCGVPDIYVRKKADIVAAIMPFCVFTVAFTALTVGLWTVRPLYGIAAGLLLSLHLGGCTGDLHHVFLCMTKYKNCNTLVRDTGPEQWFYIPKDEAEKYGIEIITER